MSHKIFSSPGVSSRPINLYERWLQHVELRLQKLRGIETRGINLADVSLSAVIFAKIKRAWRRWKNRNVPDPLQQLVKALNAGSYNVTSTELQAGAPLKIEPLDTTMRAVTFHPLDKR